jgi:hypothetical protein
MFQAEYKDTYQEKVVYPERKRKSHVSKSSKKKRPKQKLDPLYKALMDNNK